MSDKKLSKIIQSDSERKQDRSHEIKMGDDIIKILLLLFGLGFWVVMIIKYFL